jgi:hydrogenase-4 component H
MVIESLRGLIKPATLQYPRRPSIPPEGFRGKTEFDPSRCVGCAACAQACPTKAIQVSDDGVRRRLKLSYAKCSFCGRCEDVCPYDAIHQTDLYELAFFGKDEQTSIVEVELQKCSNCGRPFAPFLQLERGLNSVGRALEEHKIGSEDLGALLKTCPSCRNELGEMRKRKSFLLRLAW